MKGMVSLWQKRNILVMTYLRNANIVLSVHGQKTAERFFVKKEDLLTEIPPALNIFIPH